MFGFFETMVQYYLPGIDVTRLTDQQLVIKLSHLLRIRRLESNEKSVAALSKFLTGHE